jgi:hypothetical protein
MLEGIIVIFGILVDCWLEVGIRVKAFIIARETIRISMQFVPFFKMEVFSIGFIPFSVPFFSYINIHIYFRF